MRIRGNNLLYMLLGIITFFVVIAFAISYRFGGRPHQEPFIREESRRERITLQENEMQLLAKAVYAEAKGEPYEGQIAIAAVILNRIEHPEFPNTVAGVIYQPLAFQIVANGEINQEPDNLSLQASFEALQGLDPTNGALYFYNPNKTKNKWIRSRPVLKTIGKHIFAS